MMDGRILRDGGPELALELEEKGYVARAVDPADRRATLISYTPSGWQFLRDAHGVKQAIEAEYTAKLGDQGMATLRSYRSNSASSSAPVPTVDSKNSSDGGYLAVLKNDSTVPTPVS